MIKTSKSLIALALSAAMLPATGWTQQAGGPQSNLVQAASGSLKIVTVQGEGAANNVKARTATQPVVQVLDDQEKPVAGAEVVFQLPAAGPGGVFNGWMRTQTTRSNAQGQASASGFTPNDEEGRFNIKVTATAGNRTGTAVISQSNVRGSGVSMSGGKSHRTLWTLVALGAAAAIGGGVAATRGNGNGTTTVTNPVTITAGPVTVAGPR